MPRPLRPGAVILLAADAVLAHLGEDLARRRKSNVSVSFGEDDARNTMEFSDHFVIQPAFPWWAPGNCDGGKPCPDGFRYSSETNAQWLTPDEIRAIVRDS